MDNKFASMLLDENDVDENFVESTNFSEMLVDTDTVPVQRIYPQRENTYRLRKKGGDWSRYADWFGTPMSVLISEVV